MLGDLRNVLNVPKGRGVVGGDEAKGRDKGNGQVCGGDTHFLGRSLLAVVDALHLVHLLASGLELGLCLRRRLLQAQLAPPAQAGALRAAQIIEA